VVDEMVKALTAWPQSEKGKKRRRKGTARACFMGVNIDLVRAADRSAALGASMSRRDVALKSGIRLVMDRRETRRS